MSSDDDLVVAALFGHALGKGLGAIFALGLILLVATAIIGAPIALIKWLIDPAKPNRDDTPNALSRPVPMPRSSEPYRPFNRPASSTAPPYSVTGEDDEDVTSILSEAKAAHAQGDFDRERALYYKAAGMGSLEGIHRTCVNYSSDAGWKNSAFFPEAVTWCTKGANLGDGYSMVILGLLYESGLGVPKDTQQAISWYRDAAASSDPQAVEYARRGLERLGSPFPTSSENSPVPTRSPDAAPPSPRASAIPFATMEFQAKHKEGLGGCAGQLDLTSTGLHFDCPNEEDLDFSIDAIAGPDKDGIALKSGKKYHFKITDEKEKQAEDTFQTWWQQVGSQ